VAILGAGAQGLASVIAAKEAGAKPIIVIGISKDINKFKLNTALKIKVLYFCISTVRLSLRNIENLGIKSFLKSAHEYRLTNKTINQ
jgi:threonine dehydrogenase-like Zn-dependent dehydrogenase